MNEVLQRAVEIAKELERRKATNRMVDYEPYVYQKKFHILTICDNIHLPPTAKHKTGIQQN